MAEDEDSLEAEIVYPITCGDSKANLIWRKFVCPGINVKCVQVRIKGPNAGPSCLPTSVLRAHLACPGFSELWGAALHQNHVVVGKEEVLGAVVPDVCLLSQVEQSWLERCCLNLTALLESLRNFSTSSVCSV